MPDQRRESRGLSLEEELDAYFDGELDDQGCLEVECYLAANPAFARDLEKKRFISRNLHNLYDPYIAAPLPPRHQRIADLIARRLKRNGGSRFFIPAVLAATCVLAVGGAAWLALDLVPRDRAGATSLAYFQDAPKTRSEDAAKGGATDNEAAPPLALYPNTRPDVLSSAHLAGNVEEAAPDFSNLGFALVGKRALASNDRESMQLIYEAGDGARIELFFGPSDDNGKRSLTMVEEGPVAVMAWHHEGRAYSLVGEAEGKALLEMGRIVNSDWTASPPSKFGERKRTN